VPGDSNSPNDPEASHRRCSSAMWMQGTYDPDQHVIYWATGHSSPAHEGNAQPGEDQNAACLFAVDAESGKLKWSSRFVAQGQCGNDAPQVPVLISTTYEGAPRTLIVEANRNGFPYLLDRETGKLLSTSGKPCIGISETESWYAPSYSEQTHLFYFQSVEGASVHPGGDRSSSHEAILQFPGDKEATAATGAKVLVAYDPATKTITWKGPRIETNAAPSGLLTTSTGLLFFVDASPSFKAADAASGKLLWQFNIGQNPNSPPIGYAIGEKQYFVVAAGMNLFAFGLP
jgi:alcohol dehydrogenase (cytochrome c)